MDWLEIISNTLKAGFRPETAYVALAALGLNIHFGYTGLLNFGQAGFMAVGAYGMAIPVFAFGSSLWVGLFVGIFAAVIFALILGYPTLKLRADYLAIVTIAAAEIFRFIMRATGLRDFTGGSNGINGFSSGFFAANPYDGPVGFEIGFLDFEYSAREAWVMTVAWSVVLLGVLFTYFAINSPWGRVLKSVREDEDAVRALGKNAYSFKMQSLVIGGIFGALAGMFLALSQGSVQPSPVDLGPTRTFLAYAALIIGGTGKLWGPVGGSFIFITLLSFTDNFIRSAQEEGLIPESFIAPNEVGIARFIILGICLMALMAFRPQGVFGNKKEMAFDV